MNKNKKTELNENKQNIKEVLEYFQKDADMKNALYSNDYFTQPVYDNELDKRILSNNEIRSNSQRLAHKMKNNKET